MKTRRIRNNFLAVLTAFGLVGAASLSTVMITGTSVSALPAYTTLYCRASEWATLRSIASRSGDSLARIGCREAVTYLDDVGEFYKVSYQGMTGYVLKDFFSMDYNAPINTSDGSASSLPSYIPPVSATAHYNLYCIATEYVTLRSYPSRDAAALDYIYTGESVEFEDTAGEFIKVYAKGKTGYVLSEFFSYDPNAPRNPSDGGTSSYSWSSPSSNVLYCRASEYVTLRSYPSRDAAALNYIYTGQAVTFIGMSGEFYQVSFNGTTGYVLSKFFSSNPNSSLVYDNY